MDRLRVLMIVRSDAEAGRLGRHLRRDGLTLRSTRARTVEAARNLLAKPGWDIVICVAGAAGEPAERLAALCREAGCGQPAILILAASERMRAGELIRAGFADVVPEDNLARLGPAIEREVRRTQERQDSRRVEDDLQQSDVRFRSLFEATNEGLIVHRMLKPLAANPAAAKLFGFDTVEELLALGSIESLLAPEERERVKRYSRERLHRRPAPPEYEVRCLTNNGKELWLTNRAFVIDWPGGPAVCATLFDISRRKRDEARLVASEAHLLQAQRLGRLCHWSVELARGAFNCSDVLYEIYGLAPGTPLDYRTMIETVHEDDRPAMAELRQRALRERRSYSYEFRIRRGDGAIRHLQGRADPVFGADGEVTGYFGVTQDVTEQKMAETALRDQHVRMRGILDNIVDGIVTADVSGVIESFNPAAEKMFGYAAEEVVGRNVTVLMPEDLVGRHRDSFERYRRTGESQIIGIGPCQLTGRKKDGTTFPIDLSLSEMMLAGRRTFIAVVIDSSERKAVEAQLNQAQKMEAVGNLTGGIAHDFNNILGVIIGNLELLARGLGDSDTSDKMRRRVDAATRAAFRGAELTSRLLSFSRRQVLEPRSVDVNQVVTGMADMLQRTLQEDSEIETVLGDDIWSTRTDPSQLENALLNLAVNARDAMPDGGKLTIETANVRIDANYIRTHPFAKAGDYILLAVSDTGIGIPEEVLPFVFEPFFTTKGVDKGTGLGLSMIYGFAKQSGGHVGIYSEVGVGTTVRLYLPREAQPTTAQSRVASAEEFPRGDETLLIVEDDSGMRETAVELLSDLGYTVISAETGPEALEVLDVEPGISLMLTDMVMPGGMNGRALIQEAKRRHPALKVVLSSGYAFNGAARNGMVEDDVAWIGKPYNLAQLAQKVRETLDR